MAQNAVIFDFDGTIADTLPLVVDAVNEILEKKGRPPIDLDRMRDMNAPEFFKELKVPLVKVPFFVRTVQNKLKKKELPVFKGISDVLQKLQQTHLVGILTTNTPENVRKTLGFAVDFIEKSSVFGKHVALKKLLKKHRIAKDEAMYVGDEVRDIEACKKAGVKIAAVTWGYNSKRALVGASPDFLIERPSQLFAVVK